MTSFEIFAETKWCLDNNIDPRILFDRGPVRSVREDYDLISDLPTRETAALTARQKRIVEELRAVVAMTPAQVDEYLAATEAPVLHVTESAKPTYETLLQTFKAGAARPESNGWSPPALRGAFDTAPVRTVTESVGGAVDFDKFVADLKK